MSDPDGRVRLTVLGGFLGSGKTTWLRHQLHDGAFAGAFVIVNEAAETPVDDALLGQSSEMAVLAGGCACCDGLPALLALLRNLCDRRSRSTSEREKLQHIVLETSGLADPGPIVAAIRADPLLVHHIVVSEIVVAVDAMNALAHLTTDPLGRRQIEIADRLVVTKVDGTEAHALIRLLATLRQINPIATLSGSIKGSPVTLPDHSGVEPMLLPELSGVLEKQSVFPTRLHLDETIDWTAFSVWLSALLHARGDDVLRVKGVVRTQAGRLLVQAVRRVVQSPEILPPQGDEEQRASNDDFIVVIGCGYSSEELLRSLRYFAGA